MAYIELVVYGGKDTLVFVDDFTKFTLVAFIAIKDDALNFLKWKRVHGFKN